MRSLAVIISVALLGCGRSNSTKKVAAGGPAVSASSPAATGAAPEVAPSAAPAVPSALIDRRKLPQGPYRGPDCQASYAPGPERDTTPMCYQPGDI